MKRKLLAAISATLMAMVMTVGLAQSDEDAARRGGVLNVAYETEPVTLDMMYTTTTDTLFRMTHAFEGLFTYNEGYQIVPMLVDTYQLSEDGTVYTLTLRQGITFHDGSPLTSADAVASVLRYTQMTSTGREVRPHLASVDVVDDLTFTITLTQPFGGLLAALAYRQAIVLPAAVIEEVGTDQIRAAQAIGTGPYEFVEWLPDQYMRFKRFEGYVARDEEPSGYGGGKKAYVDEIVIYTVPDPSSRLFGLMTGDYHFAELISADDLSTLNDEPELEAVIISPDRDVTLFPNMHRSPTDNPLVRRAMKVALDFDELLMAGWSDPELHLANGGMYTPNNAWFTAIGTQDYNVKDQELARELLAQAGYDGEPLVMLIPTDRADYYQAMLVAIQQLEAVGFVIDPHFTDFTTVQTLRSDPTAHHIWLSGPTFRPEPTTLLHLHCDWPGTGVGWCNPEKEELLVALGREADFEKRFAIWEELNRVAGEDTPFIKLGDTFRLSGKLADLGGFTPMAIRYFWNVWLPN